MWPSGGKGKPANTWIPQAVRQGIPDWQISHMESLSAIEAESVVQYDQELSGGGLEMLALAKYNMDYAQATLSRRP